MNKLPLTASLAEPTRAKLTVLATSADTNGACAIVTLTLSPFDPGTPAHMHDNHAEGCYVLQGTLAMTENDQMWTLSQGAFARIPSGTRHALWNPSAAPTTILLIYQPATTEAEALALALGHSPARTA